MTKILWIVVAIAGLPALVSEETPTVSLCDLFKHPPEYRGRLVRVSGSAKAAFEYFALRDTCPERVSQDSVFDRMCLKMSDAGPTAATSQLADEADRDVVAVAEVPEDVFVERVLDEGYEYAVDSLPWTPLEYEVAEAHRDDLWQEFVDVIGEGRPLKVTLIGRFEYVNGPSMVRFRDGGVGALNGYGHMGSCSSRLVVTQVLSIKNGKE